MPPPTCVSSNTQWVVWIYSPAAILPLNIMTCSANLPITTFQTGQKGGAIHKMLCHPSEKVPYQSQAVYLSLGTFHLNFRKCLKASFIIQCMHPHHVMAYITHELKGIKRAILGLTCFGHFLNRNIKFLGHVAQNREDGKASQDAGDSIAHSDYECIPKEQRI